MYRLSSALPLFALSGLLLLAFGGALLFGPVSIPLTEIWQVLLSPDTPAILPLHSAVIWDIRLPRALLALLAGAGLSLCGTVLQASIQNPLADPYILGISAGASLGATLSLLWGGGTLTTAAAAFAGSAAAALLVLTLAAAGGKLTALRLVLSGTVAAALFTALANFVIYFANNAEGIRSVAFWTMGSLAAANWDMLPLPALAVTGAALYFLAQIRQLNTLLLGEEAALTLGVQPHCLRRRYLLITALLTGTIVAACGVIGFVGLLVPHIARGWLGPDHRRLLPASLLLGGAFLILADIAARTLLPHRELPIGILTALLGAPLFLSLLFKNQTHFSRH